MDVFQIAYLVYQEYVSYVNIYSILMLFLYSYLKFTALRNVTSPYELAVAKLQDPGSTYFIGSY